MDEGILTQLAIQLARQQNPDGRISERDVEKAMAMIKNLIEKGNMPPASMMKDTTTSAYGDAGRGREVPEFKANGGRIGYQTGGITMANTLQQNLAANQAQAASVQAMLNAARKQAGLPSVQTTSAPTPTTSAPAQTMSAPAQTMSAPKTKHTQHLSLIHI